MSDVTLVTVHGFWSDPATWDRLRAVWEDDDELGDLRVHGFGYSSPKKPRLPFSRTRVPDIDDIAQTLAVDYVTKLGSVTNVAFVTHSQGGLVLQRFLAWMVDEGRARELARIQTIVMLACPNGGSQYLRSLRRVLRFGRHPQAGDLTVLNKQVANTQRVVLDRIVNASGADDHQCRIPFHVYAGGSDAIVPAASAQAAFPGASTLAGNHFTILDPTATENRTADVVKHHILTDLVDRPLASTQGAEPGVPAGAAERGKSVVRLFETEGLQGEPPLAKDSQSASQAAFGQLDSWRLLVNQLIQRLDLENWDNHVGGLLRSSTGMHSSSKALLLNLAIWLNGRVLPDGQPELRLILSTLQKVITDLLDTFDLHCEEANPGHDDPWLRTVMFYKVGGWRPSSSIEAEHYAEHINLLSDLALELTRAVNWLCDSVRREFDPRFRFEQGALQLNGGPYEDADDRWFRPEYSPEEISRPSGPYESLEDFKIRRFSRDFHTNGQA